MVCTCHDLLICVCFGPSPCLVSEGCEADVGVLHGKPKAVATKKPEQNDLDRSGSLFLNIPKGQGQWGSDQPEDRLELKKQDTDVKLSERIEEQVCEPVIHQPS